MVVILMRMKLAVLRNNLKGMEAFRLMWGALFGAAAVVLTYVFSVSSSVPFEKKTALELIFAIWTLGWAFGPILFGGEDKTLLPENFRTLPIPPNKLATGLLGASFLGIPAIVSSLAFASILIYAAGLGIAAVAAAVPAVVLQTILAVAGSRIVTSILRRLTRSQLSSALASMVTGGIMAFFITGWALFEADLKSLAARSDSVFFDVLRALPSSWGIAAVEAAGRGRWELFAAYLAGTLLLLWALRSVWAALLVRRLTTKPRRRRSSRGGEARLGGPFSGRTGAVVYKELASWGRDYTRSGFVYFALFFGLWMCLYPVFAGSADLLPYAGAIFVVTAIGSTANVYGADGSALWMTLASPGAERYDVRGRQIAWLLVVGPAALAMTIGLIAIGGRYEALPYALPLTIAALGAGSGLVVLNSVYRLEPMADAHKRGDDLFDHPIGWWPFMSLFIAASILISPAFGLALWGAARGAEGVMWSAVPVACLLGGMYAWGFGRLAIRRLEARGPELLHLMLRGHRPAASAARSSDAESGFAAVVDRMPAQAKTLFWCSLFVGLIGLFPQGLVPIAIKLTGGTDRSWFLALYMPNRWQWPVVSLMIGIGILSLGYSFYRFRSESSRMSAAAVDPNSQSPVSKD